MSRVLTGLVGVVLVAVVGLAPAPPAAAVEGRVDLHVPDRTVDWSEPVELRALVPRTGTTRPTGTVTFTADGTLVLGTVKLRQRAVPEGSVVLRSSSLPPGEHLVVASYSGDRRHTPAVSHPEEVAVRPARATVTVRSARLAVPTGAVARFIARVAPVAPATATPTGSVTFKTGDLVRSVPLVRGVADWRPRLPDGVHDVRVILPATAAWREAESATTQRVGPEPVLAVDQADTSSSGEELFLQSSGPFPAAAQVFTAGVTGTLQAIELEQACFGGGPGPPGSTDLVISVKAMVGDSPTGTTLATAGRATSVDDALVLGRHELSVPVPVVRGTRYAIVVAVPANALGCTLGLATGGQSLVQMGPSWTTGSTALRHRTWVLPAG